MGRGEIEPIAMRAFGQTSQGRWEKRPAMPTHHASWLSSSSIVRGLLSEATSHRQYQVSVICRDRNHQTKALHIPFEHVSGSPPVV